MDKLIKQAKKLGAQTTKEQMIALYNAVLDTPKGCVVEVGSASGGTTYLLLDASTKRDKLVYSVDPYPDDIVGYKPGVTKILKDQFAKNILSDTRWKNRITQYNTILINCVHMIPEISVAFIDGCHEFSEVKKEFELIYPKVVTGGKIFIHDIKWIKGQRSMSEEGGVVNAIPLIQNKNFKNVTLYENMIGGQKILS